MTDDNLRYINEASRAAVAAMTGGSGHGGAGGGGSTYDGEMEARVAKLEAMMPTLATKEDVLRLEAKMHQELHSLTWKLIGTCAALVGVVYFIARTVH